MNVKLEIEISKEAADVADFLKEVVSEIKAGKSAGEIATGSLPKLMNAISGLDQIGAEAKDKEVFARTMGMKLGEIVALFV